MASFSYFLDKLSPETRVLIYGFVFGTCKHIRRVRSVHDNADLNDVRIRFHQLPTPKHTGAVTLHSAIFTTHKQVSEEALETFYNMRTVHLTLEDLYRDRDSDYLNFVRQLDIVDCLSTVRGRERADVRSIVHSALRVTNQLPRIKSVRILSDCLAYSTEVRGAITVREFVESYALGDLVCVDVGLYRLATEVGEVVVANSNLLTMWPEVALTPAEYDGRAEAEKIIKLWQLPRLFTTMDRTHMAWAAQTSLRLWVGLYEQALVALHNLRDEDFDVNVLENNHWVEVLGWMHTVKTSERISDEPQGRGGLRVPMHELGPGHDADTLEWATELLAMNIETYRTYDPRQMFGGYIDAKACWPELESGESIGAETARIHAESQVRIQEWQRERDVENPVDETMHYSLAEVKAYLRDDQPLYVACDVKEEDLFYLNEASNESIKKVFYLLVAIEHLDLYPHGDDDNLEKRQELDEWSRVLLCRYFLHVTGRTHGEYVGLAQLRAFFTSVIRSLQQRLVEVQAIPGAFPTEYAAEADRDDDAVCISTAEDQEDLYMPFVRKASRAWRLLQALPAGSGTADLELEEEIVDEAAGDFSDDSKNSEDQEGRAGWGCVVS